jgi:branched-chain amino acid transport system substrate-binding protein
MITSAQRAVRFAPVAAGLAAVVTLSGCGSSSSGAQSGPSASASSGGGSSASALGTPNRATGTPIVLAMIADIGGPALSAPEAYQGAEAAVSYVNNYLGGVNGRPFKLYECSNTTNTPASSATCANELAAHKPSVVLGALDTGAPGAVPIWIGKHLPYVGGLTFTPVESNASNAAIFNSLNASDNAAVIVYAQQMKKAKSVAIIESDDSAGLSTGTLIADVAKGLGMSAKTIPLADNASPSELATAAANAVASKPDLVYDASAPDCPQVALALHQVGYSGTEAALNICSSPAAIKTMGSAAEGLILSSPYVGFDQVSSSQYGSQIKTTLAAMKTYQPKAALDSATVGDFGSVMNLRSALASLKGPITQTSVLAALQTGSNHPNWMAHAYTCDHAQVATQRASCNGYDWLSQIKNGNQVTLDQQWVNGGAAIKASYSH